MTNTERLKAELDHLIHLLAPPFTHAWKAHVDDKVSKLVAWDKAYAELPRMLREAMQKSDQPKKGSESYSTTTQRLGK